MAVRDYNWLAINEENLRHKQEMFNGWIEQHPNRYTVQLSYPRSGRHWVYGLINRMSGGKAGELRTIDVNQENKKYFCVHPMAWPELNPDLRYVLLIRDPRDMILSCIHYLNGKWDKGFWAEQCLAYKNIILHILNLPIVLTVQYEQLCWNPEIELIRIREFANLGTTRNIYSVVEECSQINFDAGREGTIGYDWKTGAYFNQCLKWKKHPKFLQDGYHQMIWSLLSVIMLPFGYTEFGHSEGLLTR